MVDMRSFIAVKIPQNVAKEVKKIQNHLEKKNLFDGKFTSLENLHLTLKFLGEIDEKKLEQVKEILNQIKFNSFECELGKIGVFSEKFIKIIWIKINSAEVFELQKQIDSKLKEFFKPEFRFMSHLTIARVKKVKNKEILMDFINNLKNKFSKFNVKKFYLMKSDLSSKNPVYSEIEKYNLES